jgi:2-polyprenyl-6-methoxyphenol hydroxylase-like FAD-dependent oxidoreductase
VLISGAGIGGLVAAYWLIKAGASVTVLERADQLRTEGHSVSLRQHALPILESMGLMDALREKASGELGLKLVNKWNQPMAQIAASDASFTSPFQLRRGELVAELYELTKDHARFIFGDSVDVVEEVEDGLHVTLTNQKSQQLHFDLLVIAEGLNSYTRAKIFNESVKAPISRFGLFAALFSYRCETDMWARCHHTPNSQILLIRPDRLGMARAAAVCRFQSDQLEAFRQMSNDDKREAIIRRFQGTGWESEKVLKALREADDVHMQEIAQVKCKIWSKGRAVLLGDSAYCPSPIGGMGSTAAIVGAYTLVTELVKNPADHQAAFRSYETSLRPWIELIQKPCPILSKVGLPETRLGIRGFQFILSTPVRRILGFLILISQKLGISKAPVIPNILSPSIYILKTFGHFKTE